MIDTVKGQDDAPLAMQLKVLLEQESRYQPKLSGLRVLEAAHDSGLRMTSRLRDFEVKDLLSLTRFFGFSTETFSLAVNLLDRFLALMKVVRDTLEESIYICVQFPPLCLTVPNCRVGCGKLYFF